jgi:hypothetical protein
MKYARLLVVMMVVGLGAVSIAGTLQRPDLASGIDAQVTLPTKLRANAADSLPAVDLSGYACAAMYVMTGQVDIATSAVKYVVLEDSTPGTAAWNLVDSVAVDSTDNATGAKNGVGDIAYKRTYSGTRRWVRLLQRASGNAADTIQTTGVIIRGCKRAR